MITIAPSYGTNPSAHRLADTHNVTEHGAEPQGPCTKHCLNAEQPEERSLGYKRYGVGAKPAPKPIMTYEELFPEEEDDHA